MGTLTSPASRPFPLWKRGIKGDCLRWHHAATPSSRAGRAQIPLVPFFKGGISTLAFWLIVVAGIPARTAALGTAFTYQGQLQHSGTAENDTCDVQFTLYDAASGGTQVGSTQTLTPVSVANGLFTVQLDFGGGVFNGNDRWLQIAVRCPVGGGSYTTLTPRQPLTAAPYALYSPVAGVANDLTCTGCLGTSDLANGAVTTAKIGDGQVSIAKLSASGSTSGQLLTSNGSGVAWQSPTAPSAWSLTGNNGTTASNYLGTSDNKPLELRVNGASAFRIEPTDVTPNLVGGFAGNGVSFAGVYGATIGGGGGTGVENTASAFATVGGGAGNTASGAYATIGGGGGNIASANTAVVAGGALNTTSGEDATVGGGRGNRAAATKATVAGGGLSDSADESTGNQVTDDYGTIGGGGRNFAGNGNANTADATYATIAGGYFNTADRVRATVGGGGENRAHGDSNTVAGGFQNQAAGSFAATIGGGQSNSASGSHATVAGGILNVAGSVDGDNSATVAGGYGNQVLAPFGTISGGGRTSLADFATANFVTDTYGTIAGGGANQAGNADPNVQNASFATVGGGLSNKAAAPWATVPGGFLNEALGERSFAAGSKAHALHDGSFVWSDGFRDGSSAHANDFNVTATGGVEFYYSANGALHCDLKPNGSNWECTSDRNAKENFEPVDGRAILPRISAMPVTQWNVKGADPANRHIGPVAQDFHAAFGLGGDTTINTGDAQGVTFAAIQGLYAIMQEKDAEITDLKARLAAVETQLAAPATRAATGTAR